MKILRNFDDLDENTYLLHRARSGETLRRRRGGWSPLPRKGHRTPVLISCPICSKVFTFDWDDAYRRYNGLRSINCPYRDCDKHLFCLIENFESAKPELEFE